MRIGEVRANIRTLLSSSLGRIEVAENGKEMTERSGVAGSVYEDVVENFFLEFTTEEDGSIKIDHDKLWETLNSLETADERLALIQAIKLQILRYERHQQTPSQKRIGLFASLQGIKRSCDIQPRISTVKNTLEEIARSFNE